MSRTRQDQVISRFGEPKDLIERSYFQYLCQWKLNPITHFGFSLLAPFAVLWKLAGAKEDGGVKREKDRDAKKLVCVLAGIEKERVPKGLTDQYDQVEYSLGNTDYYLEKSDAAWVLKNIIKRYPLAFLFHLKAIERVGHYKYLIKKYDPDAIANHMEYSCSSSLLTEYCHCHGIKHVDFMHGEKVFYVRDSFFAFDEVYVWHDHYKKLFEELRADLGKCYVELPPMFSKALEQNVIEPKVDYVYYLSNEPVKQLERISQILKKLLEKGYRVRVRMHPRWSNEKGIRDIFDGICIENGLSIEQSLASTEHVIALFSTVIFQGYLCKKGLVIDNVSDENKYEMMRQLEYVGLILPHERLSDVIS